MRLRREMTVDGYPESLCHRCGAPPRTIRTKKSTFILCPLVPEKYPRQPVLACALFRPAAAGKMEGDAPKDDR